MSHSARHSAYHSALAAPRRLAAIAALGLQGHAGDAHLDAVVGTLALACRAPIALVNIPTPGLQTYPSEVGVGRPFTRVPDESSFCVQVVETGTPMSVDDAAAHPRYGASPLVLAGVIGAYAGHPLVHDGQVVGVLALIHDQARVFSGEDLRILAHQACVVEAVLALRTSSAWDVATGLARRPLLLDRVERAIVRARQRHGRVGLVVLDVNGMTKLNLRHGSAAGDAVLAAVGGRLSAAAAGQDSVARLGGDEFAVVLGDLGSVEEARSRAAELAGAVRGAVTVDGVELPLDVAFGVATTRSGDADALLAAAEAAAGASLDHDARHSGEDPDRTGVGELRRALDDDEFVLHYQPVVDLATGEVRGVEALVRWEHPHQGLLPPACFIDEAEASGLVVPLGAVVLRKAAEQLAAWRAAGRELTVAVNLSPKQMAQPTFDEEVAQVLEATGAPAELLVLEITESSVMDQPAAPAVLARLRAMGLGLALDDFGTGYSSLSYLRRFPVDTLKIDRSFVAGLGVDPDDEAIVASVVSLACKVDKGLIAEGVETTAQAEALQRLGVGLAQGFLWSRPLPPDELEAWLDAPRTATPGPAPAPRPDEGRPPLPGSVDARIWALHCGGASPHTIAAALNADGLRTSRGVRWQSRSVATVVASWQATPRTTTAWEDVPG